MTEQRRDELLLELVGKVDEQGKLLEALRGDVETLGRQTRRGWEEPSNTPLADCPRPWWPRWTGRSAPNGASNAARWTNCAGTLTN